MTSSTRCCLIWLLTACASPTWAADEPITLNTPTGDIRGSLMLPASTGKPPVALIIAGSGPTDRDGNNKLVPGHNDSLRMLATALAEAGIASVRYDKRGVAVSADAAASESELRLESFAQDAADWVTKLASDSRFTHVAIVGHSEGSLIGLIAGVKSKATAYVSIAGPGQNFADTLRRQLAGRLPADRVSRNEAILAALQRGDMVTDIPAPLLMLYRPSVQPYLISLYRHVPSDEIKALRIPCLILQGDTDIQSSVADADALHMARPECQERVIGGMNHVLKLVPADRSKQMASYGDPALPLAPELVDALTHFLHQSAGMNPHVVEASSSVRSHP